MSSVHPLTSCTSTAYDLQLFFPPIAIILDVTLTVTPDFLARKPQSNMGVLEKVRTLEYLERKADNIAD